MNRVGVHKPLQTLEGTIVTSEVSRLVAGYSLFYLLNRRMRDLWTQ